MKDKGIFITLEGNEASGKSTQQKIISEYLSAKNIKVLETREPGGTKLGEKLRHILLNYQAENIDAITEALLMFAARAHHAENIIKPALKQGVWVICDRFIDSSFAYQGGGRGLERSALEFLQKFTLKDLEPHITFFFATDWSKSQARQKKRGDLPDRFEQTDREFFEKVELGFKTQAKKHQRIKTLDSSLQIEQLSTQIFTYLHKFLH